jgi:hypothetical protein
MLLIGISLRIIQEFVMEINIINFSFINFVVISTIDLHLKLYYRIHIHYFTFFFNLYSKIIFFIDCISTYIQSKSTIYKWLNIDEKTK